MLNQEKGISKIIFILLIVLVMGGVAISFLATDSGSVSNTSSNKNTAYVKKAEVPEEEIKISEYNPAEDNVELDLDNPELAPRTKIILTVNTVFANIADARFDSNEKYFSQTVTNPSDIQQRVLSFTAEDPSDYSVNETSLVLNEDTGLAQIYVAYGAGESQSSFLVELVNENSAWKLLKIQPGGFITLTP